jgi:hypothetical protein
MSINRPLYNVNEVGFPGVRNLYKFLEFIHQHERLNPHCGVPM